MTRLHMVRHGPTHVNAMVGWSDLPADLGDTAAIGRLSDHLPPDAVIISSDLLRAAATADAIQGRRQRLPNRKDLREIHFGAWEMRRFAEIEAEDPEPIRSYWTAPGDVRAPGGESWNDVCARVDAAVDALIAAQKGRDLVIVAHLGVILSQLQRALDLEPASTFGRRIDNLSVTELVRLQDGWRVERINHLP